MVCSVRSVCQILLLAFCAVPVAAHAQEGSIGATATVVVRGLALRSATIMADPTLLRVRIDGCGSGVLSVNGRQGGGELTRISQLQVEATATCGERDVLLPLPRGDSSRITQFDVSLSQTNALVSPAFQQFVVTVAAARRVAGSSLVR